MAFNLQSLFGRNGNEEAVQSVYQTIVDQARKPGFYRAAAVPDTASGRYAMVALHGFLVMDRLGREDGARDFSQALFDTMFVDMDRNLREMGVGDLSVGKKVKGLAQYFYAMAAAFREGMKTGGDALAMALRQYVYQDRDPGGSETAVLGDYVRTNVRVLAEQGTAAILSGRIVFSPPPGED